MRTALLVVAVLGFAVKYAAAECAAACNGNGECSTRHDFCICNDGFMGNSCEQRTCPVALSYIDTPFGDLDYDNRLDSGGVTTLNPSFAKSGASERHPAQLYGGSGSTEADAVKNNEGHFYAECANRGLCDRSTGLCDCFTGYEGAACNRTACVNSCSGHGTCEIMSTIVPSNLFYRLWEAEKTQVCKCDGGYFGIDCSQKKCMKNDDPLTDMSTQLDYNYGISERSEVQWVDVKCPFGGDFVYPSASLVYTDAQFGDVYETPAFDFTLSSAAASFKSALKSLPNQVLADFMDPVHGDMVKVNDVQVLKLETNNHYRIAVTFNELLGDVPSLSAKAYFKCKGGAEVISDNQNVAATYTGHGPTQFLKYVFTPATTIAIHTLAFSNAAAGTFTLSYNGATTGQLSFTGLTSGTTDAPTIQAGLNLLSTIAPGSVTVTPVSGSLFIFAITFSAVALPYSSIGFTGTGYGMLAATAVDTVTSPNTAVVHDLTIGAITDGTATVTFGGVTSVPFTLVGAGTFAANLQAALNGLSSIYNNGGGVVVASTTATTFTVQFNNVVSPLTAITYTAMTGTTTSWLDVVRLGTETHTLSGTFGAGTTYTLTYGGESETVTVAGGATASASTSAILDVLVALPAVVARGTLITATAGVFTIVNPTVPNSAITFTGTGSTVADAVTLVTSTSAASRTVTVYDESGKIYNAPFIVGVANTGLLTPATGFSFLNEADKVTLKLGAADKQLFSTTTVNIHVKPRITVSNPTFALQSAIQTLTFTTAASAGTYRLAYNGQQTGFIAFTAGAASAATNANAIKTALNGLSSIYPGYVTVSGDALGVTFTITFFGVDSSYTQFVTKVTTLAGTLPSSVAIRPSVPTGITIHTLALAEPPTATDTFTITYGGVSASVTVGANAAATATAIQTALAGMSSVLAGPLLGGVTVVGKNTQLYFVTFNFYSSALITTSNWFDSAPAAILDQFSTDAITNPAYDVLHTLAFTSTALAGTAVGVFTLGYNGATATVTFNGVASNDLAQLTTALGTLVPGGYATASIASPSAATGTFVVTFSGYSAPYASFVVTPSGSPALSATATDTISTPASSVLHTITGLTGLTTIGYGGQTAAPFTVSATASVNEANIRTALHSLSSITAGGGYAVVTATATTALVRVFGTTSAVSALAFTGVTDTATFSYSTIHTITFNIYSPLAGSNTYGLTHGGTAVTGIVYTGVAATDAVALAVALNNNNLYGVTGQTTVTVTATSPTVFVATIVGSASSFKSLAISGAGTGCMAASTYAAVATLTDSVASVVPSFGVVHDVTIPVTTPGTAALTFGGYTTAPFHYSTSDSSVAIQAALNALPSVNTPGGGSVTVSFTAANRYTVLYTGVAGPFASISYAGRATASPALTAVVTVGSITDTAYTTSIPAWANLQTLVSQESTSATLSVTSTTVYPGAGFSSYDVVPKLYCISANCKIARLFLNGEIMGLIDATVQTPVLLSALTSIIGHSVVGLLAPFPTKGTAVHRITAGALNTAITTTFQWGSVKAPLVYTNLIDAYTTTPHPDAGIAFSYWQNVAVSMPLNLVLKISSVTGLIDQFQWKVAGDWDSVRSSDFQAARDITTTSNICLATGLTGTVPAACNSGIIPDSAALAAWHTYLVSTSTQDNTAHREINRLRITFTAANNDLRASCLALTSADYYYFQFGTNGINDAPECSDRGVCDYATGLCKCFKGYAGIDCSSQNALASGAAAA